MFLKWAGGKRRLLKYILPLIPKNIKKFYEPFFGSGAITFSLDRNIDFVANDKNEELIMCYEAVREDAESVISFLDDFANHQSEDFYYEIRSWDKEGKLKKKTKYERAARLIFLNKTGFNGLWRVNSSGFNNVPFGHREFRYNADEIRTDAEKLKRIELRNGDFAKAVEDAQKEDFVYFDPPYLGTFDGYAKGGFGEEEQKRLRDVCKELSNKEIKILVSNSDNDTIRNIWKDFDIQELKIFHALGCKNRKRAGEVLIRNF